MKKNFPILLLMVVIILFAAAGPLAAADPVWQLTVNDNGTITESIALPAGISCQTDEWKVLSDSDGLVAERTIKNWSAYMQLKDRLPLQVTTKNFILFQDVDINKNIAVDLEGAAEAIMANNNSKITLRAPGIINQTAGTQIAEDQVEVTAAGMNQLPNGAVLLQMTTFNGLMLGIVLFVLGFLAVVIVFMNRIRKVNQLIDEEYSLERAAQQLEEEESGEKPADKEDE